MQNVEVLLDQSPTVRIHITDEQQAGEAALDMLIAGEADIALVSNYLPYREDITTVIPLYPSVLHIAYRIGRDASSGPALLNHARIYAGKDGSASRLLLNFIVARMNLPPDAYSYIESPGAGAIDPCPPSCSAALRSIALSRIASEMESRISSTSVASPIRLK